jgi:uncharacterized protein
MQAVPFSTFLCKVAARCNLDCDYCYVYHHADQSWRTQPHKMSLETAAQLGTRINEHALAHGLKAVAVTLHGGEPLLATVEYLHRLCTTIRTHAPDVFVSFSLQTNGTLFDQAALDLCLEWHMRVGLSFDGPRFVNDRHRLDHAGRSSFAAVERALTLLTSDAGRQIWSGFLAVLDLRNDPLAIYSYLKSFRPPALDFLMPLCHYDVRPSGKERALDTTPYADWLLQIFEVWYQERPQQVEIRRFHDIISLLLGATYSYEELGLTPVNFIVVETDGELKAVDSLKITYPGADVLGLTLFEHSFDDALRHPAIVERQVGQTALCTTCQQCDLVNVCGGGYYPHRYSQANGFQNPSVYCADLTKLIRTLHARITADLKPMQRKLVQ